MYLKNQYQSSRIHLILIGIVLTAYAIRGSTNPVYAMPSSNKVINGTIAMGDVLVEGANVSLIHLGQMENKVINSTLSNINGEYYFSGISTINEYKIQVSFGDKQHAKYYRADIYNKTDFNFNGNIVTSIIGIDEINAEGFEIGLYNLLGENEVNATVDSNGLAVFDNIDSHDGYYVVLYYNGLLFSALAEFGDSSISNPVIEILEATTTDEDFKIAFQHVIIRIEEGVFKVREMLSVQNAGSKVFNTSWLRGSLPSEAYDITHDTMDCCINFYENGDYVFDPMKPLYPQDSFQLSLDYFFDIEQNYLLEKKIVYDTDRIFLLVEKNDKTTSEGISGVTYLGADSMGDIDYYFYEGTNHKAGESIQIRIITEVSLSKRLSKYTGILELLQLAIPVVMVLGFFVYRRIRNSEEDEYNEEAIAEVTPTDK